MYEEDDLGGVIFVLCSLITSSVSVCGYNGQLVMKFGIDL